MHIIIHKHWKTAKYLS